MARRPDFTDNSRRTRRLLFFTACIIIVCLVIGIGTWTVYNAGIQAGKVALTPTSRSTATAAIPVPTQQASPTASASSVSPLIFGTNVSLFDQKDQLLNSAETRTVAQQLHPTMIRMPTRQDTLTLDAEIQMANIIKAVGATPLIILQGPNTNNPIEYNKSLVQAMNGIFGASPVYYEFSNEQDYFHHTSAQEYVTAWNNMIPTLKAIAPNAQFIGPVTSSYKQAYLMTFLQQAQPKPDEISWHEYTCNKNDDPNTCLDHIDQWTQHIQNARAAMQTNLGKVYPIMITEWNYAGDAAQGDGKSGNDQFMTNWTTKALQTLAANRVFASMQYSLTNTPMSLISDNNTLTPQGTAFKDQYQMMIVNHQQPDALSPTGQ